MIELPSEAVAESSLARLSRPNRDAAFTDEVLARIDAEWEAWDQSPDSREQTTGCHLKSEDRSGLAAQPASFDFAQNEATPNLRADRTRIGS
jgi:hypothetical protein